MRLPIAWTDEAKETFDYTILQIEAQWGDATAGRFVKDTHKVIDAISLQPYLFKSSIHENVRQAFISKQTSMFYEVHGAHITILYFWDNRQEPII